MRRSRTAAALAGGLALLAGALSAPAARAAGPGAPGRAAGGFSPDGAFARELRKIEQISSAEFARRYSGKASYLGKLSWDPTTGKFWDAFNKSWDRVGVRYDFRLNKAELAAFRRNGFVVSERLGARSFAQIYYRAYNRHLPVFVTSDSLLHAWHRSYDAMLEELEEGYLAPELDALLAALAAEVPRAKRRYGKGVLADSLVDADYFLAVARSLLAGRPVDTHLGLEKRVRATLAACQSLRLESFPLFGRDRTVDFSQFKVRGHYEHSEQLRRYFQAAMWCGRIDLRVAGGSGESSARELGAAVVLNDLLRSSRQVERWRRFDRVLRAFVGETDSMTFAHLDALLARSRLGSPADVKDLGTLRRLQADIRSGKVGLPKIAGDSFLSPPGSEKAQLPHSSTVLGQKFVPDSWALSRVVFDDVVWDGKKVMRRVPSGLDVAFAVLGNDQVVPELTARMNDRSGRRFRDGLPYQHNLSALRNVLDAGGARAWEGSLYLHWLACLRELSAPTTGKEYPEAMRTRAWARKTVNTQLASWAQMRHDTILYAKPSYTREADCFYPAGFVEPVPHFWARFERMARGAAGLIEKAPDFPTRKKQADFCRTFARRLATLREIARKELAREKLTRGEVLFLKGVVEAIDPGRPDVKSDGGRPPRYEGWYFDLFYKGREVGDKWDALVADVHTDVPDGLVGDPGCVLHQGVGNVDLLLIAVDSGKDHMVYAGPVLSHYEFEVPGVKRKSDSEWQADLQAGRAPPRPEWTRGYLVPEGK
jgi:hypothetical protein